MARYLPSIRTRAPESEQYFAVPGQEFLGLLVAVRLQEHIHRIFPDALHHRKKEDKLKTWKRDCPGQFLCGSKYALSENSKWSGSPYWSISYYFLYKKEPFFSPACRGKTVGADMNAFEICLDCKKQNWTNFAVAVEKTWWECRVLAESLGLEPVKAKHSLCTRIFPGPGVEFRHILCSLTFLYG